MKNDISIIILLYEENWNTLLKCLDSVKNFKIIIVDNSGNKKRKKIIEKKFTIYKYILNKKNLGFGAGNNIGIKNCDTKYSLILSSDCIISEDAIFTLQNKLEEYENCFLTTPTFYDQNGLLAQNASSYPHINSIKEPLNLNGDICCQSVLGAAMFCRTSEFKKIGMFDENFFIFYEDDDLCRRIDFQKKSKIQVFNAKAIHQHGQGKSVQNLLKRTFLITLNMTFSELYYFYKIDNYKEKLDNLKKKIPSYVFKIIISFFKLRFIKFTYYLSKILAFLKFKRFLKKIKSN